MYDSKKVDFHCYSLLYRRLEFQGIFAASTSHQDQDGSVMPLPAWTVGFPISVGSSKRNLRYTNSHYGSSPKISWLLLRIVLTPYYTGVWDLKAANVEFPLFSGWWSFHFPNANSGRQTHEVGGYGLSPLSGSSKPSSRIPISRPSLNSWRIPLQIYLFRLNVRCLQSHLELYTKLTYEWCQKFLVKLLDAKPYLFWRYSYVIKEIRFEITIDWFIDIKP